jgi:hypothetical protein
MAAALLLSGIGAPAPAGDFELPPLTGADLAAAVAPERVSSAFGVPALTAPELAQLRGGFVLPTGVEIDFGAVARTFSDGSLILETQISWNPDGSTTEETFSSPDLIAIDDLANGFALQDANGSTLFAHQVDDAGVRNILLNDATGRDLLTQTQLTVTLPGFETTQAAFRDSVLTLRLFDDLNAAP